MLDAALLADELCALVDGTLLLQVGLAAAFHTQPLKAVAKAVQISSSARSEAKLVAQLDKETGNRLLELSHQVQQVAIGLLSACATTPADGDHLEHLLQSEQALEVVEGAIVGGCKTLLSFVDIQRALDARWRGKSVGN